MVLHRTRHLFVRQQTALINALRAHLVQFGIVAPVGRGGVEQLVAVIEDRTDTRIPHLVRTCLTALRIQLFAIKEQIRILDWRLAGWHRSDETCKRLDSIPGVGRHWPLRLSPALPMRTRSKPRGDFSAWVGLVPKQNSSDGKERLGSITKAGDRYLRSLFCAGALAVIRYAQKRGTRHRPWLTRRLEWRPVKVAATALANNLARMAWAMTATEQRYSEPVALAK